MKIDYVHCPMRKFWRTSLIETVWTEQRGHLEELRYLGKAALVCPGLNLGEVLFARPALPHGAHRG